MTHEQFLQNIITYLTIDPPPLEKDNTEEEINELEKLYNELKVKQESELQELNAKLIEAKKKVTKSSDIEMTNKSQTEIAKESAKFPVMKETEHGKLFNSSILKREFKIFGTTGEPGQTEKLSFVSLTHQIDSGIKRGYKETDIVDAVIRSSAPHSSLCSYVETLPDLNLGKLRKILHIHFREKTASELYLRLSIICQKPK